ncbi:MAG: ribosomal-processing cysteine protease Prp [Clostridia bacterium]|nr:ribosomal-processing cysteine protease Prp [Clostridia bacterium]
MIEADFFREEKGIRLRLTGHANYVADGDDIVCAAVSGIFYALVGYLANTYQEGLIIRSIETGRGDVTCSEAGEEAMKLACIGLLQIALTYPGCLLVRNSVFPWKIKGSVE